MTQGVTLVPLFIAGGENPWLLWHFCRIDPRRCGIGIFDLGQMEGIMAINAPDFACLNDRRGF